MKLTRNRKLVLLACLAIVVAVAVVVWHRPFVQYTPLVFDGTAIVDTPALNTSAHLDRLQRVLDFYNEQYHRPSMAELLVSPSLHFDRDRLWNYTTKAEDLHWLAANGPALPRATP